MDQGANGSISGAPNRRRGPAWQRAILTAVALGALLVVVSVVVGLVAGEDTVREASEKGTPQAEDVPDVDQTPTPPAAIPTDDDATEDADTAEHEVYVAPWGSDHGDGTRDDPFETIAHGLSELRAGDTLLIREGTYNENIELAPAPGEPDAPILITSYPGEQAVLRGLLWLEDLHHVVIERLHITWDDDNHDNEHMVKIIDGSSWVLRDSRLSGARSYAALLVASSRDRDREPADWLVSGNCIHDTRPTNRTNQDHLLYVNAPGSTGGVIEGNLLFDAPNGAAVKVGPASDRNRGTSNTVIRYNTVHNTSQSLLFAWGSGDNVAYGNIFGEASHVQVRGFELTAEGNVVRDNAVYGGATFIYNDEGYEQVTDGGNTFAEDARFDDTSDCSGFSPLNGEGGQWGHLARG